MVWDAEAHAAKQKRKEDIIAKLKVTSMEGSEIGEGARALIEFLQNSNMDLMLPDDLIARMWDEAEKCCEDHFQWTLNEAASEVAYGHAGDFFMELTHMNEALAKAGLPEHWPEGYTKPTEAELEALGRCVDHPWESYEYTAPRTGCDRCVRLYVKRQDEKIVEKNA